jgi:hypothetical protein
MDTLSLEDVSTVLYQNIRHQYPVMPHVIPEEQPSVVLLLADPDSQTEP